MTRRVSRRRVLQATGVGAGVAVAGCLGSGSPNCDETLPTPYAGDPDAEVVVKAFEDFACGHCGTYNVEHLPPIFEEYVEPGQIRYEHHDFPLQSTGAASRPAASAARAVQVEADLDAFWEYVALLYENQASLGSELYGSLAEEVGVDADVVRQAASDEEYDDTVQCDRNRGDELGVQGTPTVFVDGSATESYSTAVVSDAIDAALQLANTGGG